MVDDPASGPPANTPRPESADPELAARIQCGAFARAATAPPLHLTRLDTLSSDLEELRSDVDDLRVRIERAREVRTMRSGIAGRVEILLKRTIQRLVQRHLDQQREIDEAVLQTLRRVVDLVTRQQELHDRNASRTEELTLRQEAAGPLP